VDSAAPRAKWVEQCENLLEVKQVEAFLSSPTPAAGDDPPVRGHLHLPETSDGTGLLLSHGAGSDADAPLLVALADALAQAGVSVARIHLPYRQQRPKGPPYPAQAARDRAGIRQAVGLLKARGLERIFAGGHSYGGRQTSMVAAEDPALAAGLLLLSYPLHPPGKPLQPRTGHFPALNLPVLFVHGTRDPFGSPEEMQAALELLPRRPELYLVEGSGHELIAGARRAGPAARSKLESLIAQVLLFLRSDAR
jgi:uncharacterized protein